VDATSVEWPSSTPPLPDAVITLGGVMSDRSRPSQQGPTIDPISALIRRLIFYAAHGPAV
jgi:hypothetical protein